METIKQHRAKGILTCLKHFPGHGSSQDDSHYGIVDATETWSELELEPFSQLISQDLVDLVMTAHIVNRELDVHWPATLSNEIIQGILRKKLKFDGVVISDDLDMEALVKVHSEEEICVQVIEAGVDLLLFANHQGRADRFEKIVDYIETAVRNGEIEQDRIEESYKRIKRLKDQLKVKAKTAQMN